jgi:DNA-binding transcriptional ArsR family regulator
VVINNQIEIHNKDIYVKLKLISNKTVFKILEIIQDKELTTNEIISIVKISKPKVLVHLTNLNSMGLISKRIEGKELKVKSNLDLNDFNFLK